MAEIAALLKAEEDASQVTGSLGTMASKPGRTSSVPPDYKPHAPVRCKGEEYVALVQADIRATSGPAVVASGTCHVDIRVSRLASDAVAISVSDEAEVSISHSEVTGAVSAADSARVSARDSHLRAAPKVTGKARFDDQGGNTFE